MCAFVSPDRLAGLLRARLARSVGTACILQMQPDRSKDDTVVDEDVQLSSSDAASGTCSVVGRCADAPYRFVKVRL